MIVSPIRTQIWMAESKVGKRTEYVFRAAVEGGPVYVLYRTFKKPTKETREAIYFTVAQMLRLVQQTVKEQTQSIQIYLEDIEVREPMEGGAAR